MKTGYLTVIFALACAACTPRFYPPKVDVPDGYLYGEGFPRDTAALASDWWRLFGDTVLDNLVQRALENNRDVAVAAWKRRGRTSASCGRSSCPRWA